MFYMLGAPNSNHKSQFRKSEWLQACSCNVFDEKKTRLQIKLFVSICSRFLYTIILRANSSLMAIRLSLTPIIRASSYGFNTTNTSQSMVSPSSSSIALILSLTQIAFTRFISPIGASDKRITTNPSYVIWSSGGLKRYPPCP